MIVGIPRTRSVDEKRVGLPPRAVGDLVDGGSEVIVERKAGKGSGFTDEQYDAVGARIVHSVDEIYGRADLVVRVNRPQPDEYELLREGQTLMSLMHLAVADRRLTNELLARKCAAVDLATVQDERGNLPVLRPLSQIAGRMVPQIAARYLQTDHGGLGILLGGGPAIPPAEVVIIGGGTVGRNAIRACVGAGARVTLVEADLEHINEIDWAFPGQVTTWAANQATLRKALSYADVVVGAVLTPGHRTPHLVSREMVGLLREGSLIIDISVDQGGCFETSRPTRLSDPTYVVDGITHYCVPNLTSLVARTATYAMANATLPYVRALAEVGLAGAIERIPHLASGVNVAGGKVTHTGLAQALDTESVTVSAALKG